MSSLADNRNELRKLLADFAKPVKKALSEEDGLRGEASYAASNLKDENPILRMKAVEFLEILSDNPYSQEYLLDALDDQEASVVNKAIMALGKMGNEKAVPRLKSYLKSSKSRQMSGELARIISKLEKRN